MSGDRLTIRRKSSVKIRSGPASPDQMPPPPTQLSLLNTDPATGESLIQDDHGENIISGLLEPAIEGPPSPESIRAFSKQMQRVSVMEKHQSQQTSSSGSSSLRSHSSADRPSWEDGVGLSRRSSGRSTTSSMRDRPESVQIFGKSIFNRRGKRRESSARETSLPDSSATSSLHSADAAAESAISPGHKRDTFVAPLFHWRRTTKPDTVIEEHEPRRKLQISGPYNFQHVTHTPRNAEPSFGSATQSPLDGDFQRNRGESMHFANFSSEAVGIATATPAEADAQQVDGRASRASLARSSILPPPIRPPRSPVGMSTPPMGASSPPPIPPPRVSSRSSMRPDEANAPANSFSNRPRTSSGARQPPPLSLLADEKRSVFGHSYSYSADLGRPAELRQLQPQPPPTIPDESNWPLTCPLTSSFESALPDVPEEEEHPVGPRKSRASIGSLRGSQSVPMLRQLLQSAGPAQRPASGASDTLGHFDLFAAQRALKAAMEEGQAGDSLPRENWEDAIDYCYDHEAEADCDYAWERPSMDLSRDDTTPPARGLGARPGLPSTGSFEVPALSPSSHLSAISVDEVLTPVMPDVAGLAQVQKDVRVSSRASSFRESHGFNLSPSLLIPGSDYYNQMMASERDEYQGQDDFPQYDDSALFMRKYRASASTTTSDNSTSDRHYSTASASTALTRLTMSTSSLLDMDEAIPEKEPLTTPTPAQFPRQQQIAEPAHSRGMSEPAAFLFDASPKAPSTRQTVDNTPTVAPSAVRLSKQQRPPAIPTRSRARTASTSYSLFPGASAPRM